MGCEHHHYLCICIRDSHLLLERNLFHWMQTLLLQLFWPRPLHRGPVSHPKVQPLTKVPEKQLGTNSFQILVKFFKPFGSASPSFYKTKCIGLKLFDATCVSSKLCGFIFFMLEKLKHFCSCVTTAFLPRFSQWISFFSCHSCHSWGHFSDKVSP